MNARACLAAHAKQDVQRGIPGICCMILISLLSIVMDVQLSINRSMALLRQ